MSIAKKWSVLLVVVAILFVVATKGFVWFDPRFEEFYAVAVLGGLIFFGWAGLFYTTRLWAVAEQELEAQKRNVQAALDEVLGSIAKQIAAIEVQHTAATQREDWETEKDLLRQTSQLSGIFWNTYQLVHNLGLKTRSHVYEYLPKEEQRAAA